MMQRQDRVIFSRPGTNVRPQFIPGEGYKAKPVGNLDEQMREAAEAVKAHTASLAEEDPLEGYIRTLEKLNVQDTIALLSEQSEYVKGKYLEAERKSRGRSTVLSYFGQPIDE